MAGIVQMKDNVRFFLWLDDMVKAQNKLGNLVQIGDIGGETETVETTTLESLAKEYETGFTDNGTIDLVQNLTSDEYTFMEQMLNDGVVFNFGVSVWSRRDKQQKLGLKSSGIVTSLKATGFEVGSLVQVNTTIQVSGALTNDFVDPIGFDPIKVTKITLGGTNTIDTDGGTTRITATVEPAGAANKKVIYTLVGNSSSFVKLSDSDGASVTVTGLADGTATIKATATDGSGVSATIEVTVQNQA